MILVTVGMHTDGFLRLVKGMDNIAAEIDEEVVIQIGATPYEPRSARWFAYATQADMDKLNEQARVIVSHAGSGTILTALQRGKPLVVMPRLNEFGEHVDDHQIELAQALSESGALLAAHQPQDLPAILESTKSFTPQIQSLHENRLIENVRQIVDNMSRGMG